MSLSLWQILLLAVVQGITEFLPISSDGHLVVISALMGGGATQDLSQFVEVNIVLHLGTLASILVYYWRHVLRLMGEDRRLIGLLILATIPAVVVGLPIKLLGEWILGDALFAGLMLPVTGLLLILASRAPSGDCELKQLHWKHALLMGTAQSLAILPGLSRSGSTITAGILSGLTPKTAATFSFLMAIPAIAGAGVLEGVSMLKHQQTSTPPGELLLAAVVAFAVGLGAISLLVKMIERGRLHWFAWWCIPLGIAVSAWQIWLRFA